jgi:uncharacterized membrane protein
MSKIVETIAIEAPAAEVWRVVHEDIDNVGRWAKNLRKAELVDGEKSGPGSRLRYTMVLTGGKEIQLVLRQSVFTPPRRCAGEIIEGPLGGSWSWEYREQAGTTHLTYTVELKIGGLMRVMSGLIADQYAKGTQETLSELKVYIENDLQKTG